MQKQSCPVCDSRSFCELADFGKVPSSGTFLSEANSPFSLRDLAFEFCEECALVRQRDGAGDTGTVDYTNVPRKTSAQAPLYAKKIPETLLRLGVGRGQIVIEVGANDGAFLEQLSAYGYTNVWAIEPSRSCASECRKKGFQVEEQHLDAGLVSKINSSRGRAAAVICRHTLEHVPDPRDFLRLMSDLLEDKGILFLEVPSSYPIIRDLLLHELWDEHIHIFTPSNLGRMVVQSGFEVIRTTEVPWQGTNNILMWLRKASGQRVGSGCPDSKDVLYCRYFSKQWKSISDSFRKSLDSVPGPVAAIGASHPQSNFFLFTASGDRIQYLIDDDPGKIGHFVPLPKPVPVISSTRFLEGPPPSALVLSAFRYEGWMEKLCAPLIGSDVSFIRPYEPRFLYTSK